MLESNEAIRPLRDRVLVKELPWREVTDGGLFMPQQAKEHDQVWRALVLAVGPGKAQPGLLQRVRAWISRATSLGEPADYNVGRELAKELGAGIDTGFGADVQPGDVVLVSKYVHSKVRQGGEEVCVIAATDILGVVTDGSNQLLVSLVRALANVQGAEEWQLHAALRLFDPCEVDAVADKAVERLTTPELRERMLEAIRAECHARELAQHAWVLLGSIGVQYPERLETTVLDAIGDRLSAAPELVGSVMGEDVARG